MRREFRVLVGVLVPAVSPVMAHACTVCHSSTGQRVRELLFDGHFASTLLLVALPFPVFAMAIGLLHFGMPGFESEGAEPVMQDGDGRRCSRSQTPVRPDVSRRGGSW